MATQKLAAKLVDILKELGSVPKKGFNKNQNYHYMREVDVLEALKEQLVQKKIILLTSSKHVETKEKAKIDKNDNKVVEFVTTVSTTHTFIDSDTGESYSIDSVGQGYDSLDKGASKAITAATKYALMKTFMISDEGADIENDGITPQAPVATSKTFNKPTTTKIVAAPGNKVETKQVGDVAQVTISGPVPEEPKEELIKQPAAPPAAPAKTFARRGTATKEPNF